MSALWLMAPDALARFSAFAERAPTLAGTNPRPGRSRARIDGVAVVPLSGMVAKSPTRLQALFGATSTVDFARDVAQAASDASVKALVLVISSPGGEASGTEHAAAAVRDAAAAKPTVAWVDGAALSAGYWIASAAHRVFLGEEADMVGSIGVAAAHIDVSRAEASLGVKVTEVTAGRYKRAASIHAPLSDEGRAEIQAMVDHMHEAFVAAVAAHRRMSPAAVRATEARVYAGRQGIAAGLADAMMPLESLVARLAAGVAP
jgi:signal peptide peptidase SppA